MKFEDGCLIFKTEFGSHVYGTAVPGSDRDCKGIFIPSAEEILLQRAGGTSVNFNTKKDARQKNSESDVDLEMFTLQSFIRLCAEGQTVAVDMLFTPKKFWIESSNHWEFIQRERATLIHGGVSAFVGYCQKQAAKYGIKGSRLRALRDAIAFLEVFDDDLLLSDVWDQIGKSFEFSEHVEWPVIVGPGGKSIRHWQVCNRKLGETSSIGYSLKILRRVYDEYGHRARMAESNEGVDWKALYHAVRVCGQAKELLTDHFVTFPRPDADLLLKIRKAELPYLRVAEMIENGVEEVNCLAETSTLPKSIDKQKWDRLVYGFYHAYIRNS